MKILSINGRLEGHGRYGVTRVATELTSELMAQGHDVHTLSFESAERPHPFAGYNEHIHSVLLGLTAIERLEKIWDESGPFDSILAWDWAAGLVGSIAKRVHGTPLVAWMHGTEVGRQIGRLTAEEHYASEMERWLCERADRILVPSEFAKRDVSAHYDVPTTKLAVIPTGARLATFSASVDLEEFRAIFAEPSQPLILFAGEFLPSKGADVFADSVAMVLDRLPKARFVAAGDGAMRGDVAERSRGLVRLVGEVSEPVLGALYQAADLLVIPSRYEVSGLSVLEARLHGLPVVATRAGALEELPDTFFAAELVGWENPFALAHAIAQGYHRGAKQKPADDAVPADFRWPSIAKRAAELLAV